MHITKETFSRFAVCAIASVAVFGLSAGAASAKSVKFTNISARMIATIKVGITVKALHNSTSRM